ncbi:MAG TPA: NAD(P)/FAD-dependent oxidoreductase [Steroidobacteraceae bacterium]|nr:NAD(P)/FAD-dependent oxidoreductase [Steroidobacteraceae bacterium]
MSGERREVVVIGAGPSGAIASALLKRRGRDVLVLERQRFPRFSIGESLLAHCLDFVEEAGMLPALEAFGFQYKDGAAFARGEEYGEFGFGEGPRCSRTSAYQVERAKFDTLLADEAVRQGVEIRFETEIVAVECGRGGARLTARSADGAVAEIEAGFVLDASGFGRTLPRLLHLERPSSFPVRHSIFTHVEDHFDGEFDRDKILVTVHQSQPDVWFWLIPFSGGRASVGVVARREFFTGYTGTPDERLRRICAEDTRLKRLLTRAVWDTPAREIGGFAVNVTSMHGPGFALLGNAAEFLDPVFSSGVTIAMRSASLAASALERQLSGASVDWDAEFERPLRLGVDVFREFVDAWYDGRLQTIFFGSGHDQTIRGRICAILAGYAWDTSNPFVTETRRRLDVLAQVCARRPALARQRA